MSLSNVHWGKLSEDKQEELRQAARIEEGKRAQERAAHTAKTGQELANVRLTQKLKGMSKMPPRLIFSSCTFGAAQEESLTELFRGGLFEFTRVQKLRRVIFVFLRATWDVCVSGR